MKHVLIITALAACGGGKKLDGVTLSPKPDRATGLASFETVRSVLQHPRCQNCHPADDRPLQGDEGRPHNQNIQRGLTGLGMTGAECTTCHRETNPPPELGKNLPPGVAKGWHMPPPEMKMVFVGVSPGALCEQIKDPARNGGKDAKALREHLDDPLVVWAWAPGFGRKPPPISHAAFVSAWESWSAAGMPCP